MYIPLTFEGALAKCLYASGGYEGYFISASQQWKYHIFTSSANLEVQKGSIDGVQIYVVAGGGGGALGTAGTTPAGGGGGGGVEYKLNARLYQGIYNVSVGKGGDGALTGSIFVDGGAGQTSSFSGVNLTITASAGQGGTRGSGTTYGGGTSGNGLIGGTNAAGNGAGGGGGGALTAGVTGSLSAAGNGGTGITINIGANSIILGCGGGGYAPETADDAAYSCMGTTWGAGGEAANASRRGANAYGMGGGAGSTGDSGSRYGGSGSVIIKYPIYDYCNNFFNETGSCNCQKATFDISDNYNLADSGTYYYTPCGTNQYISASIYAYYPITVCASSGTYYNVSSNSPSGNGGGFIGDVGGKNCTSQSAACITGQIFPTSSVITTARFAAGGSGGTAYYLAKNATTMSIEVLGPNQAIIRCVQTGSAWIPGGLTGAGSTINWNYTPSVC